MSYQKDRTAPKHFKSVKKIFFRNECTQVTHHRNNITIKTGEEARVPAGIQDDTIISKICLDQFQHF